MTVRGVVLESVVALGLIAQGGTVDAAEVIVRGSRAVGGSPGRGVDAIRDGTLSLSRSLIESTDGAGSLFGSGAQVTITDVLYRDTGPSAIGVQEGAVVSLSRVAMLRATDVGFNANNDGTMVTVEDVYVAGDGMTADRGMGLGVGAQLEATGVYLEHIGEFALFVTDAGSAATISDVYVADAEGRALNAQRGGSIDAQLVALSDVRDVTVLASSEGSITISDTTIDGSGRGLRAQTAGTLQASRVRLTGVVQDAIQSSDEGTTVVVEDLDVQGGTPGMDTARGGAAFSGSSLTVRRAVVRDAVWGGFSVHGPTSTVRLEDAVIEDIESYFDGTAGYGLAALEGTLDAERVRITNAHTMGVGTGFGAHVTLTDVFVSGTQSEPASGLWGRAVSAQGPDDMLTVVRGVFEDSIAAGVFAGTSTFDLRDIVIRTTKRRDCMAVRCAEEGGVGLVSYYDASVHLESFLLTDNDIAGAQLGEGGELDLVDGVVSNQPIGVSIQTPGYDFGRLTDSVRYEDNGSNLDTNDLPVPQTSTIASTDEPPED